MKDLSIEEILNTFGGSEETYNNGYAAGSKIRNAIVDAYDYARGFLHGLFYSVE